MAYAASGCRLALALALRLADTRSRSAQFIAPQCASTQRTAVCATAPRREGVEDRNAAEATDETMAARRPLGTLTNTQQQAAAPPKPAPKPAVYRCDHCFSFTGSYAAVAAHEATCPCAAPSIKREVVTPPPAAPAPPHHPAPPPCPCARCLPHALPARACATGRYTDALLGKTYAELHREHALPSDALRLPDAASIPSAIAQAPRETTEPLRPSPNPAPRRRLTPSPTATPGPSPSPSPDPEG